MGNCPAMSSCQRWATALSSCSRTSPDVAATNPSSIRAAIDIEIGSKAAGRLISEENELGYWFTNPQYREAHAFGAAMQRHVYTQKHQVAKLECSRLAQRRR